MQARKWGGFFGVVLGVLLLAQAARSEYRTWTAVAGGFSVDAEFVELREGGLLRLRLKNGDLRDVPLEKLSLEDRQYAARLAAASARGPRLGKLEHDVARARTAEEGLRLYRVFNDSPQTTAAERAAIAGKLAEFRDLAGKKLVRMGSRWVTDEELKKVRGQANSLMKQGLELLRLKQEDAFRKKFAEAAALEPDNLRADFFVGILYGVIAHDNTKALQRFQACLKRDPENVAVLNNLALTEAKLREPRDAVLHWRKAIELGPDQSLVQNLGRFLELAGEEQLKVPKTLRESIAAAYAALIADEKFERVDLKRGWMYALLDEGTLLDLGEHKEQAASNVPPPSEDGAKVIGGGTGFVVAPGYILTNNHVVEHGTSFEVQANEGAQTKTYRATLVAFSKSPDLALLECKEVSGKPLAIDPGLCRRGTDIMALGYPEMFSLGASLKASRGVISAVPSSALDDMYLYDAVINPGNSGGPVCDNHGNVVAVTTILVMTAGKYGGGIPSPAALEFVKKHVPNYAPPALGTEVLDWPAVDEKVSPATVLVWSRSKSAETASTLPADRLEDRSCMICNGLGLIHCIAPGCVRGVTTVQNGSRVSKVTCPLCGGKSIMACPICKGTGIDPALKREEPTASPPGQNAPRSSGPPVVETKPGSHPPLSAAIAERIRNSISSGRTVNTPRSGRGGTEFRDLPESGALLVGLVVHWKDGAKNEAVGVTPVYQTTQGQVRGDTFGLSHGIAGMSMARLGYAVGGVSIPKGSTVEGMRISMLRDTGTGLDPNDNHTIRVRAGNPDSASQLRLALDGSYVIGILGATSNTGELSGFGLVLAR